MWGDVPLTLNMLSAIKTDWERTPVADVRRQIISDYRFAQDYIPTEGSLQGRLTKGAVQTLLAEMYLTIGKPDSALFWCDQVINNPAYKLMTARYGVYASDAKGSAFGDMFKEGNQNRGPQGNKEALWVFQFQLFNAIDQQGHQLSRSEVGTYNSISVKGTDGKSVSPIQYNVERGGRGKSYFAPTKWWIDSYEKTDDRAQNYILRTSFRIQTEAENNIGYTGTGKLPADKLPAGYKVGDTIWCHWTKDITALNLKINDWPYSRKAEGTSTADVQADYAWTDQIYIRLADTYLLKAEAQFKLGNLSDVNGAAASINVIRNRSKATPITAAQVTLDFILDERSRELFIEEERRMTLLRTQKWFTRTQLYNKFGGERITLRDTIFPIPQDVIDANLTKIFPQNPGY
jgi:starch-binding outer membrane protein, SusD/RagB family